MVKGAVRNAGGRPGKYGTYFQCDVSRVKFGATRGSGGGRADSDNSVTGILRKKGGKDVLNFEKTLQFWRVRAIVRMQAP